MAWEYGVSFYCFGTTFAEAEKNEGSSERDEAMVGRSHAGGDAEEAVSVEWAEKCLSIHFKCLCGKDDNS